ncbi:hypothetical protein ACA910_019786 [Epithemia clementina (nom. ined.)]
MSRVAAIGTPRGSSSTTTLTPPQIYPGQHNHHGYELFLWGGPERREGENEPVYAEGLGGVGVCQIAFTTPLIDGNSSSTTTSTTTMTRTNHYDQTNQNQQQLPGDPEGHDNATTTTNAGMVLDPRNRAVAFVLTKDQQVLEWGPCPNWSAVDHKSRKIVVPAAAAANQKTSSSLISKKTRQHHAPRKNQPSYYRSSNATAPTPSSTNSTTTTTNNNNNNNNTTTSTTAIARSASPFDLLAPAPAAASAASSAANPPPPSINATAANINNNNNTTDTVSSAITTTTTTTTTAKTTTSCSLPGLESSSLSVIQIATGLDHYAAVTSFGHLYTWGSSAHGKLGHFCNTNNNNNNNRSGSSRSTTSLFSPATDVILPKRVEGFLDDVPVVQIRQVACGDYHTVALTTTGQVYSWGKRDIAGHETTTNNNSTTGAGSTANLTNNNNNALQQQQQELQLLPRLLKGALEGQCIGQVAARAKHSAALTANGQALYTWGKDNHGQLGHGSKRPCLVPTLVQALCPPAAAAESNSNWMMVQVSCGTYHMAVLNQQGQLYTFGNNKGGQLGTGDKEEQCVPRLVSYFLGGEDKSSLCSGGGNGNYHNHHPHHNKKKQFVTQVACGKYHTVVLTRQGHVFTWGYGYNGQLGHGSYYENLIPHRVEKLKGYHVEHVGADGLYTWALISPSSLAADDISFTSSLRSMVNNEEFADVEFELLADHQHHHHSNDNDNHKNDGDEDSPHAPPVMERVYAHRSILIQRSHLFRAMFRSGMRESTERVISISSDIRKSIFLLLLEYIYTNTVVTVPVEAAFELWEVAEMHGLKKLQSLCCQSVERNISVDNAALLLQMAAAAAGTSGCSSGGRRYNDDGGGGGGGNRNLDPNDENDGDDNDNDDDDDEDDPKNRLKEICMSFVVHNFAKVSQTEGLQQITNVQLCHEIMMEVADAYCG